MLSANHRAGGPQGEVLAALEGTRQILWAGDPSSALRRAVTVAHELLGLEAAAVYQANPSSGILGLHPEVPPAGAYLFPTPLPLPDSCCLGQQIHQRQSGFAQLQTLTDSGPSAQGRLMCAIVVTQATSPLVLVGLVPEEGAAQGEQWLGLWQSVAACVEQALDRSQFEEVRDRMVSSVSHELRTPLTSIRAFSEMLLDGDAGRLNARQRRYVERIAEGAERLERLTSGLLRLSRLKLGPDDLDLQEIAVRPLLEDIVLTMEPSAQQKGIRLEVVTPATLPSLVTDSSRLQQALCNFVDNAIKYSPAGTAVRLEAVVDGDRMILTVVDQGPGIATEEQARVFDEFFRCPARVQEQGENGSGLGLSIVQRLAILLGSEVWLQSAPGEGSTFGITLPLKGS